MTRPPGQPADEWDFVPHDDDVDADTASEPSAEVAAMHVEASGTPATDAGRSDVDVGEAAGPAERQFDDEEPEHAAEGRGSDDVEPDLEEVLESQHYAFEPDE